MICRVLLWGALLTLVAAPAAAQEVAGTWNASTRGPQGQIRLVFNFEVDGTNLTGTMSAGRGEAVPISDGVIDGDSLSFTVTLQGGPRGEIPLRFSGRVQGDELLLTRTFVNGPPGRAAAEQRLTARRTQ